MGNQDTKKQGDKMNQNQQSKDKGFTSSDRQRDSDISKQSGQDTTRSDRSDRRERTNADENVSRNEPSKANKQNR